MHTYTNFNTASAGKEHEGQRVLTCGEHTHRVTEPSGTDLGLSPGHDTSPLFVSGPGPPHPEHLAYS